MSEPTKILNMEDILASQDTQYLDIVVPEWGGTIRVGSLPAQELIEWTEANEGKAKRTAGIRLIVNSLVNAKNERVGGPQHIDQFMKKDAQVCTRVIKQILVLNGLNAKAQEDAKNDSGEASPGASPAVLH